MALKILLITNTLVIGAAALLGPIYAVFADKLGGDILEAGSTFSVFSLVAGLTTLYCFRRIYLHATPEVSIATLAVIRTSCSSKIIAIN